MELVKSILLLSVVFVLGFGIQESFAENAELVTVVNEFDMTSPNDITVTLDIVE